MRFWSITTTVRNPERVLSFLKVFKELEGKVWNKETQKQFQILLIHRKIYGIGEKEFENTLTPEQLEWLYSDTFTYEQAQEIFNTKNYKDSAMRGRQSLNPLKKMGFVYLGIEKKIVITSLGELFLAENRDMGEVFFKSFLKWQYPNPYTDKYNTKDGYNIKPLIATFHLIRKVNEICERNGVKSKGVSKIEFTLFFTTLSNYKNIDPVVQQLVEFRQKYENKKGQAEKDKYVKEYFLKNYSEYKSWRNAKDYADNIIRYFRLTRFFYLRGNGYYIDLEPRRKVEIDALLEIDDASALEFDSKADYVAYISDISKPELPWENKQKLQEVVKVLLQDIETAEKELQNENIKVPQKPVIKTDAGNIDELKKVIELLRSYRRNLFDAKMHNEVKIPESIENCIESLKNIFKSKGKKPIELERIITLGLHILNDVIGIRPNYPVGDDNQPTFTAPANKPDIECFYKSFNSICEVTLLSNRSQWFNEGQPVMRHFRDFETAHNEKQSYCLFIAPKIHRDTGNTFWVSVKYEYEGQKQKIIPMTIQQFIEILQYLLQVKKQNKDYFLSHKKIQELFDSIVSVTEGVSKSDDWLAAIPAIINKWGKSIAA